MKISLIIPAHNEEKIIGACLNDVILHSRGGFSEIIVVDNASTDNTSAVAARFPEVKVVYEERKGTNSARLRGLKESSGELVAFFDADTRLPPKWIGIAEEVFSTHAGVVGLSGPYKYYDGTAFQKWTQNMFWWATAPIIWRVVGYMILGGNFVARRDILLKAGINPDITFYGDDTDIAKRLSKYGKVVFRMDFFTYSSMRRMLKAGLLKTNIIYCLNFFWPILFGRPFTKTHDNIRS
ncbi:MAG: glycosyltransferase family A protein [Candidatus Taylorbacteria bacterium]